MKQVLFLCIFLYAWQGNSQSDTIKVILLNNADTLRKIKVQPQVHLNPNTSVHQPKKPELFNSGFIDFQNSGQMNASARVF